MTEEEKAKEMARKYNAENVGKPEEKKGFLGKVKSGLNKVGEAMKQGIDQQALNAASSDYAFASPDVRSNVENGSEAGKALTEANATDIVKGSGFEETNKALAGEGDFAKAAEATQHTADAQGNPNPESKTNLKPEDGADGSAPANAYDPDKIKESLGKTVDNYGAVEDYYKNSATNAWNELGKGDQRIMLFDQLGTMLRNNAQYKPKLYGAFGNVVDEGQAAGTEKSKLDNFLSENLKKGLERRNTRLNDSLETQLSQAGFEPKLEMAVRSAWENLKTNNRAKVHLINLMKDVDFMDAMKAGAVSIAANGSIIDRATGTILGKL